jgi:hypothetical protein
LDLIGYASSITKAASAIDFGRKGFATRGKAEEGRISYEKGIAEALSTFKEAQATADPQIMILAEYTFLIQELQFCEKSDKDSLNSLTKAIQSYDDAFLALKVVENKIQYQGVNYAKIQLLTIKEIFEGRFWHCPSLVKAVRKEAGQMHNLEGLSEDYLFRRSKL